MLSAAGFQSRTVGPVEEEDGVGDIREDAGGVGTLLDLEVETRAIDRDADPRCQILGQRELVRTVLRPVRAACERQGTERPASTRERHADQRDHFVGKSRLGALLV